jgi:hypothetical protein
LRSASLIIGIALTASVVFTMVQAMLIPRVRRRPVSRFVLAVIGVTVRTPLALMRTYRFQDRWLAGAAGLALLLQLVIYVALLIFSMGLVVFGSSPLTFGDALYQAGATVTTLGIVQPVDNASTVACFVGAFLGLVVIAVFIGYLMAIYSDYGSRESPMTRLSLVAGEPAWGPQILARSRALGLGSNPIDGAESWIGWTCDLRVNQLVNPVLGWFRSTSPNRHWCISLLALLDATALQITMNDERPNPQSIMLLTEGALTLNALGNPRSGSDPVACNWALERALMDPDSVAGVADPGLTRQEWEEAIDYLVSVGLTAPRNRDRAWQRFAAVRGFYGPVAQQIARRLHAIPAPWSGSRTPPLAIQWPDLAQPEATRSA